MGVLAAAWFWLWWLTVGHGEWTAPAVIVTALLAWVFALPFYFFFFASRMTRPNPALPVPDLRCAMVVTKAPSEAWSILQHTLEAALAQDFPHSYDVWLADERPTEESVRWCAEHGVKVSTRFGVAEYHQPEWPRRTKSKEGNLAYFYDHVGYSRYDVVAQLDADHVPSAGYLAAMVRPFADPGVGYVSAPSVCDANADKAWTVRGRLFREAAMHGPVQAGSNGGFAPVCIGSHYAVRTRALKEVGGLGPELAEDYTTTLWLQSGGWDGVFSIDAEAHGDGPESVAEMLTQEIQWARSLGIVLTRYAPTKLRTVPLRARL
ncbi:MAG: glycosyltransferase, partial [Actinobacteria bacterium]|nr:glycosyltransferase [Actinomycetota bacterium]